MSKNQFWENKKVFITGHTGFKGTWLLLSLLNMGAIVKGYSLMAEEKSLFINVEKKIKNKFSHLEANILDLENLRKSIEDFQPDVIIHLAAQAFVRKSYKIPLLTWETNVLGSLNVLEASKSLKEKCSIVMITTDKVYKNNEWLYGYRENDSLGGIDPYSASKAGAEIAINSWRKSYCNNNLSNQTLNISTARAGNVIGGGDWGEDRLIPDIIKSLMNRETISIRNPQANRPWQHVLEPINGYLMLAEKLYQEKPSPDYEAFNFGPNISNNKTVTYLVQEVLKFWPGDWEIMEESSNLYEAHNLHLQSEKAERLLGWQPKWNFEKTIYETITWYMKVIEGENAYEKCTQNIEEFFSLKKD